jgi:flagellar biosynthesis chaperone FliJ
LILIYSEKIPFKTRQEMKKFVFSLQKVLELKNQLLENMKIELTNLNMECEKIEIFIKKFKNKVYGNRKGIHGKIL